MIARARIFASGHMAETTIEPPGLSIPRTVLDLLLWECAQQAGVTAHSKCEVLSIDGHGPFTVDDCAGRDSSECSHFVHRPLVAVFGFQCGRSRPQVDWD